MKFFLEQWIPSGTDLYASDLYQYAARFYQAEIIDQKKNLVLYS